MELNFSEQTLSMFKALQKDVTTAGISTGTNLNFYYLEQQAKSIYPVFYPLLASTPRVNPMYNGVKVGGTGVNWKAITAIDTGGYPAISEGNRNEFMKFKERDYFAAFKYLGKDTQVSFQAEQTGLGFDDNIALAQLALLNALLNDEERMILYGNSGSAGNGYQLGTSPTPVAALVTDAGAGTLANVATTVFCIALTPWGVQLATTTSCALPRSRVNADGSIDVINGGTSGVSLVSNAVTCDATHKTVKATVAPVVGAVGYAWYVNQTDNTKANAFFYGVTAVPTVNITSITNTNQAANASNASGSFATDNSANALDFDGCLTWCFNYQNNSMPSYVKDLGGAGFTSNGDGSIAEFEAVADFLWINYKASIDKIYCGGALIQSISKAILTSASGPGAQRMVFENNQAGQLIGGVKIAQYRWKYSNTAAAKVVDIQAHPWLPDGVVYFDITNNPYPAAGNAIPSVRRIVSLEDHFSIKWPYRKLQHELGVYCFQTMQHYIPFVSAVITGAANKVQ